MGTSRVTTIDKKEYLSKIKSRVLGGLPGNMVDKFYKNLPDNTIINDEIIGILQNCNAIDFHKALPGYKLTPLIQLPNLSKKYNVGSIYIKDESHRFGLNAFKVLGASYAIYKTLEKIPKLKHFVQQLTETMVGQ